MLETKNWVEKIQYGKTRSSKNWNLEKRGVMKLGSFDLSLISNGNQKESAKIWPGFLELSQIQGSHIPGVFVCLQCFFQTRRAEGEEHLEQEVSVPGQHCHRAEIIWSGPRCELVFLAGLAVEAGQTNLGTTEPEPELKPGLATVFCVIWPASGQSGSGLSIWSVRAQGPGALQLLPGSPATWRREAGPQFPNTVVGLRAKHWKWGHLSCESALCRVWAHCDRNESSVDWLMPSTLNSWCHWQSWGWPEV